MSHMYFMVCGLLCCMKKWRAHLREHGDRIFVSMHFWELRQRVSEYHRAIQDENVALDERVRGGENIFVIMDIIFS